MNMEVDLDGLFLHNGTYDYDDNYQYEEEEVEIRDSKAVLIPVFYSVAFVVGAFGTGLLLAVLAHKRRSWSISDTFILHLSIADILLLVTLPIWAAQASQSCGWCVKGFLCKISGAAFNINFYFGIFLLLCISLDRYLSIFHNIRLYSLKRPRSAHIRCIMVWLTSLILTISNSVVRRKEETICVHNYIQSAPDWQLYFHLLQHILGFVLPAAVLIFCWFLILLRPQCDSKGLPKQKSIAVILPLTVVFFVCWMPYNITLIMDTVSSHSNKSSKGSLKTALIVTSALGCIHACLRPMLCLGLCANFRKQTLAMLRCTTVKCENSLWELGMGEEALPHPVSHEGDELTTIDHQVQSARFLPMN